MFRTNTILKNLLSILLSLIALESYHKLREIVIIQQASQFRITDYSTTRDIFTTTRIFRPYCYCFNSTREYIKIQTSSFEDDFSSEGQAQVLVTFNKVSSSNLGNNNAIERTILIRTTLNELTQETITCDLFKTLKRGRHQKVISFSFDDEHDDETKIKEMINQIRVKYKGYVARVYYNSIDANMRCQLECTYSDVLDFCNVSRMPASLRIVLEDEDIRNHEIDLSYMKTMTWRILPIGDTFVHIFMSRSIDSQIIDRETDSVGVWLKSNNYGHIMRGFCSFIALIRHLVS